MKFLDVCAAVILRKGKVLLATRPSGTHLAGKWEFPGGKMHPGETQEACIRREIHEELGLAVNDASFLTAIEHTYPEKRIRLIFMLCAVDGDAIPVCHEGQSADWFSITQLNRLDLAPADKAFVKWLADNPSALV